MGFFRMLKMDCRRLFQSRNFYLAAAGVFLIRIIGAFPDIRVSAGQNISLYSLMNYNSGSYSLILMALVALPFGLSYRDDVKYNYIHCVLSRGGREGYYWAHTLTAALGAFLAALLGYGLSYLLLGFFFPAVSEVELESLRLGNLNAYENLITEGKPVLYLAARVVAESAGYGFLAVIPLVLSVWVSNSFLLFSASAVFYYASIVICSVLRLPDFTVWYLVMDYGGWIGKRIPEGQLLLFCVLVYFGCLVCLAGLLFSRLAERRQVNG